MYANKLKQRLFVVLKVQPQLERRYFFFAHRYLILMRRFHVKYYFSVKIGRCMHYGINTDNNLTVGTEKTLRVQLFFKSGEGKVYDMFLSAFCNGKGDFIF